MKKSVKIFDEIVKIDTEGREHCDSYDLFARYLLAAGGLGFKLKGLTLTPDVFEEIVDSHICNIILVGSNLPVKDWGTIGYMHHDSYLNFKIRFDRRYQHGLILLEFIYDPE